jgi:hypothetical protein
MIRDCVFGARHTLITNDGTEPPIVAASGPLASLRADMPISG